MRSIRSKFAAGVALVATLSLVTGCGLPRSGPNKEEIYSGSVLREGDAFVIAVDDRVNRIASLSPTTGFSSQFLNAGRVGSDTIAPGDVLSLTIWENVDDGLLVATGQNATVLTEVQVDGSGYIFVPYAGRVKAAGNSPEAIRRIITNKLDQQTPDPQVEVRRLAGDGSTVSIVGDVGASGVYPIERPTRMLSGMLAQAGGSTTRPEITRVSIVRGGRSSSIWFQDLFDHPGNDIALRPGDRIILESDTRSYTALGSTGAQNRLEFESQKLSAIEAIAQVGGLISTQADPTGVFIFRNEPAEITKQLVGDPTLVGDQRVIYVLDLTRPNGMFMARDFAIRDDDTLYVTEAPFVQFNKGVAASFGVLSQVQSVASLTSATTPAN